MSSHLHSRKKGQHQYSGSLDYNNNERTLPITISGNDTSNQTVTPSSSPLSSKPIQKRCTSVISRLKREAQYSHMGEVRVALIAVVSFLIAGLVLGYFLLHHQHRRVIVNVMKNPLAHGRHAVLRGRVGFHHHFYTGPPKYVTVVMPSVVNPSRRSIRLDTIQETWGPYARSIFVVENVTTEFPDAGTHSVWSEDSQPEDTYSYPQVLLLPKESTSKGETTEQQNENAIGGVHRLIYVIRTIYERVNPDFAFFVNDHTFVIPEHLCYYLSSREPTEDVYEGHALKNKDKDKEEAFNSGASGYIFSRSAMAKLIQQWDKNDNQNHDGLCTTLKTRNENPFLFDNPGIAISRCLSEKCNIRPTDTRKYNISHRFHVYPLIRTILGKVDEWYKNKHMGLHSIIDTLDETYEHILDGENSVSSDSVSFHYVEAEENKALFATREALLENPKMTSNELKSFMIREWPTSKEEIGFYSQPLPDHHDIETWRKLMKVIRKISTRDTQRDC